jgi:hypothetical protein
MKSAAEHVSAIELEQGLADVLASPTDQGRLRAIFVRPAANERRSLETATLTPEGGIDGDRWATDGYYVMKDGRRNRRAQVTLINGQFLRQIAGADDAMCLAGDNLIVDFDLSEANMRAGSRLAIGPQVVIEISDLPHTGCNKFAARFGQEARDFANNERGKMLHLRGLHAQIICGGTIRVGDSVCKAPPHNAAVHC